MAFDKTPRAVCFYEETSIVQLDVYNSFLPSIQGLGLYAARDIEKHTMVIEYIGTIIRNEVANRKEKLYESQVLYKLTTDRHLKSASMCVQL